MGTKYDDELVAAIIKEAEQNAAWSQSTTIESKDIDISTEENLEKESSSWSFRRAISEASLSDALLFTWVVFIASFVPIIIELSKDPKTKQTEYSSYFLNGCQEFLKCFVSFIAFLIYCGKYQKNFLKELKQLSFTHWCYFFFASACYAGMNNIDIKVIDHMDPATFQLISRFRLLTTTAIWWLIFRVQINKYQLLALCMILFGTSLIVLPKLWEKDDKQASNENSVGFDWHGIYLLAIEFIFQAAGSISSEWVLKRDMDMSIWLQGVCMYSWGSLINFILFLTMDRDRVFMERENPFKNFNQWAYILCVAYCAFGITIGVILKRFSTVVKMVCSSFANISTILLTLFILNKTIKGWFIPGASVIILAVGLYGFGAQKEKDRIKKLKKKNEEETTKDVEFELKTEIFLITGGGSDPDVSSS